VSKLIGLLLVLILVFIPGTALYATQDGIDIDDPPVPAAPAENVIDMTYEELQDEVVPRGDVDTFTEVIDITEEEIPKGDVLPQTGGIPAEVFYAAGALLIMAALVLSVKKATVK